VEKNLLSLYKGVLLKRTPIHKRITFFIVLPYH